MIVHLYCVCRNEATLLPYLLRHYEQFVDKLIFVDAGSTDGTRELIQRQPHCELRDWHGSDALADDELTEFSNTAWREARGHADWIIWIDADEFFYHPQMRRVLEQYKEFGITVPRIAGYTMVSQTIPVGAGQIYDEIKTGFYDDCWCKRAIFNPGVEMRFNPGRHSINVDIVNPVSSPTAAIKLLHYRALGMDWIRSRHARNWERVPDKCRRHNYGINTSPDHDGHHGLKWFEDMLSKEWPNVI